MPDRSQLSHCSCREHREWQERAEVWAAAEAAARGGCGAGGGGVVVVWCEVVMGFWGFRSFLLLCHNAQLFNQKLSTELLNLQYDLVPLSSGQAPSLPKLSDSLLL